MPDQEREGERPHTENTGQPPNLMEQAGIPHEQLVQSFRGLIRDHQAIYQQLHSIGENPHEPDARALPASQLDILDVIPQGVGSDSPAEPESTQALTIACL